MLGILFGLLWSGIAWVMTGVTAYGLFTEPSRIPDLWFLPVTTCTAGLLSASWIIWQLRGKEILEIDHEGLRIWHEWALLKNRLSLRLDEIEFIRAEEDRDTPWWIREQYGIGGGSIVIGHNGRKRRWGIDLEAKRAVALAIEMRRCWEERLAVLK